MKRWLSFVLAAVMALGTAFAFTACGEKQDGTADDQHTDRPSQGGGNKDDEQEKDPSSGKPIKEQLIENVLSATMQSGRLNVVLTDADCRAADKTFTGDHTLDGYFRREGEEITADLFANSDPAQDKYGLMFLRGHELGYANAAWSEAGVERGDFDALLTAYREKEDLTLTAVPADEADEVAAFPVSLAVKLAMNLPELAGGMTMSAVEDGYTLAYDPIAALKTVINGLSAVTSSMVKPDTEVRAIFGNTFIESSLKTLCHGITASEVTTLPALQKYKSFFPTSTGKDLFTYIKDIIYSESYYRELPFGSRFGSAACLGDLTVKEILSAAELVRDEEGNVPEGETLDKAVTNAIRGFNAMLASIYLDPLGGLLDYFYPGEEGETLQFSGDAKIEVAFRFGADKSFTGVTVEIEQFKETSKDGSVLFSGEAVITLTLGDGYEFVDLEGIRTV